MRLSIFLLAILATPVIAADPPARGCLELPPEVREAWHVKPTDCLRAVSVVNACDVTPPDIAKKLGIDLSRCANKNRTRSETPK